MRPVLLAAAILVVVPMPSRAMGQTPPDRWVAVYAGGPKRPHYAVEDLVDLLAAVDSAGRPRQWLCNGALFVEFLTTSGRYYMPQVKGAPATGDDWVAYLDSLFSPGGPLDRLDSAAARIDSLLGTPDRHVKVSIMVPYPYPGRDTLVLHGNAYSMAGDAGRFGAVAAYLHELKDRFGRKNLKHSSLEAVSWLYEGAPASDTSLLPRVGQEVRRLGLRFLWVPSFGASGALRWRALGFDQAFLQPNYFFHPDVPTSRLDSALALARGAGMGLELEFDRRLFGPWEFADRLGPYLSMLENAPDMRGNSIVIYEGAGALILLARSQAATQRALYTRLVTTLQ